MADVYCKYLCLLLLHVESSRRQAARLERENRSVTERSGSPNRSPRSRSGSKERCQGIVYPLRPPSASYILVLVLSTFQLFLYDCLLRVLPLCSYSLCVAVPRSVSPLEVEHQVGNRSHRQKCTHAQMLSRTYLNSLESTGCSPAMDSRVAAWRGSLLPAQDHVRRGTDLTNCWSNREGGLNALPKNHIIDACLCWPCRL